MATSTINRAIHEMGYSHKKLEVHLIKRSTDETKRQRYFFVLDAVHYWEADWKLIFIDEFSKNVNVKPHYSWGKRGVPKGHHVPIKKESVTVTAAISWQDGFMGHKACIGGSTAITFASFLQYLIEQWGLEEKEKWIIVADNARIHHSQIIKTLDKKGISK